MCKLFVGRVGGGEEEEDGTGLDYQIRRRR